MRTAVILLGALSVIVPLLVAVVLFVFHRSLGVPVAAYIRALATRKADDRTFALEPQGSREAADLARAFNTEPDENASQLADNTALLERLRGVAGGSPARPATSTGPATRWPARPARRAARSPRSPVRSAPWHRAPRRRCAPSPVPARPRRRPAARPTRGAPR